jgi:hypothetical protein
VVEHLRSLRRTLLNNVRNGGVRKGRVRKGRVRNGGLRDGPARCCAGFFPFKISGLGHGLADQAGHQSIGADLAILKSVRFAEEDLQNSRYRLLVINQQD